MSELLKKHLSHELYEFWTSLPSNDIQRKAVVGFVKEFCALESIKEALRNSHYALIPDRTRGVDGCVTGLDNVRFQLENKGCSSSVENVKSKQLTDAPELTGRVFFRADIHRQGRQGAPDRAYTRDEVDVFSVVHDDETYLFDAHALSQPDGITLPNKVWIFVESNVQLVVVPSRGNKSVVGKTTVYRANEAVRAFDAFAHARVNQRSK